MNHIAIIMDGNRRFAKKQNKPASFGHFAGAEVIKLICNKAKELKVTFLTLFAFSTENWNRGSEEISSINKLLEKFLNEESENFIRHKTRVLIIGDKLAYSKAIQEKIKYLETKTAEFTDFTLSIALNYGGRREILDAVNAALKSGNNYLAFEDFEQFLQTAILPDIDLLIRTGGMQRISNFMLWKLAYSELYFTETLWPEFTEEDLIKAIQFLTTQKRNFGV